MFSETKNQMVRWSFTSLFALIVFLVLLESGCACSPNFDLSREKMNNLKRFHKPKGGVKYPHHITRRTGPIFNWSVAPVNSSEAGMRRQRSFGLNNSNLKRCSVEAGLETGAPWWGPGTHRMRLHAV